MTIKQINCLTTVIADIVPGQSRTDPYSYTTKPDADLKLTDLSIIGVPTNSQGCKPTVQAFPAKFNIQAQKIWAALINDKGYLARTRVWGNLDLIWHNTIQEFLELCEKVGVFPFANNSLEVKNEAIKDFVRRARIILVQYANECQFFSKVKVRKAYRTYTRTPKGMTFTSWADVYPLEADNDFESWIQTSPLPRMLKKVDNRYIKVIQPHVRMWVRYINRTRVRIGFDIDVIGTVGVPKEALASKQQVDAFIDKTIYFPIIRSHRFEGVTTRLF